MCKSSLSWVALWVAECAIFPGLRAKDPMRGPENGPCVSMYRSSPQDPAKSGELANHSPFEIVPVLFCHDVESPSISVIAILRQLPSQGLPRLSCRTCGILAAFGTLGYFGGDYL